MRQIGLLDRPGSADKSETASIDLTWAVTGATWLVVALLVCGVAGDPDFWGHLRFGLDIFAQRQLTAVDPYSFTQDVPWVNHEWLSELLMAAAFQTAGLPGMLLLKLGVVFSAFAFLWRAWRPVHPLLSFVAMVIAAFGAVPVTRTTRPQMWTLLCLVILVSLLQRSPHVRMLGAIALLFTAWINLHGGAILGMGVVGLWATVAAVLSWRESRSVPWLWLLMPVVAALATLVNPVRHRHLAISARDRTAGPRHRRMATTVDESAAAVATTRGHRQRDPGLATLAFVAGHSRDLDAVVRGDHGRAYRPSRRAGHRAVDRPSSRRPLASTHVGVASALTCSRRRHAGSSTCDCVTPRTVGARDVFLLYQSAIRTRPEWRGCMRPIPLDASRCGSIGGSMQSGISRRD